MASCRFDPQQLSVCVRFFDSDAQRNEAYLRAQPFQMRTLLEDGWRRNDSDEPEVLFDIYKPRTATRGRQSSKKKRNNLILPSAFEHFLDTSKADAWRKIFENPAIFMGIKQKGNNVYRCLYISSSRPLSNIFYLLQVLAPGMLVISRKHQLDDADVKVSRVLPRPEWIQSSRVLNMEVMPGRTVALLAAAKDRKIAFHEERTTRPRYNSDRESEHTIIRYWGNDDTSATWEGEGYDWTVCDKDCGWCGRCQFW